MTTPTSSWFASPEGLYTLVSSLNIINPVGNSNFLGSSAPTTLNGATPIQLEPTPIPPPITDSRISVVSIKYPPKDSISGLGMAMGSLRPRLRENSTDSAALNSPTSPGPISPSLGSGGFNMIPSLSQSSNARESNNNNNTNGNSTRDEVESPGGAPLSSLPSQVGSTTPTTKKKQLSGSFSLSSGNSNGTESSRPIRQFRGTSSTFVRSWDGLPLTQSIIKGLESNTSKETVFAFYTLGKGVIWSEIQVGRPKEHLCKITFSVAPTAIDVCQATATHQQLDVLVGFITGDIFWFGKVFPFLFAHLIQC